MPVVGFLVRKTQPKRLIAFGFLVSALALWHLCGFNAGVSFRNVALARVFLGVGLAFLFVPINTLAFSNLPEGKSNNASALTNLMRNLGGSVGISMGTTLLVRRSQVHQDRLIAHLTPTALLFQQHVNSLTQRFAAYGAGPVEARRRATAVIMGQVQTQSATLSYLDVFEVLMVGCLLAACLTVFLKKIDLSKAQAGG
jgi:DHA2 family multidrug resistance protein